MSKSNDSSKLGRAPRVRELRDDELETVSGGYNFTDVMVESIVAPRDSGQRWSFGATQTGSF